MRSNITQLAHEVDEAVTEIFATADLGEGQLETAKEHLKAAVHKLHEKPDLGPKVLQKMQAIAQVDDFRPRVELNQQVVPSWATFAPGRHQSGLYDPGMRVALDLKTCAVNVIFQSSMPDD